MTLRRRFGAIMALSLRHVSVGKYKAMEPLDSTIIFSNTHKGLACKSWVWSVLWWVPSLIEVTELVIVTLCNEPCYKDVPLVCLYNKVIMSTMASQITSLAIVYSTVYSGADQRKHQSFASLAFVRGIHRWPVNSPHKWPGTRKMFSFDDVIMWITQELIMRKTHKNQGWRCVISLEWHLQLHFTIWLIH